jgi:hypothetical protein
MARCLREAPAPVVEAVKDHEKSARSSPRAYTK